MQIVAAFTTYNRLDYLKKIITSFLKTRNLEHDWIIIIADDGSTDGTLDYAQSIANIVITNDHRGIHFQVNRVLKLCSKMQFNYGFKFDDDLIFKKPGWDDKYIEAIKKTNFDHLVFHDLKWYRKKRQRKTIVHNSNLIECNAFWDDTQGALWTFTPRVIEKVGYIDVDNYGACGFGHRDYTFRCCKAKLNVFENIFDIKNSNDYIELNKENYKSANLFFDLWNTSEMVKKKNKHFSDKRIYVPYKELPYYLDKKPVIKLL